MIFSSLNRERFIVRLLSSNRAYGLQQDHSALGVVRKAM